MTLLTHGNTAKLYCLEWIAARAATTTNPLHILDLGCGDGRNFVELLARYPHVRYTGVEPSPVACARARVLLAPHAMRIVEAFAYDIDQLVEGPFDIVVSFSVLEHVYQRLRYLATARRLLKPDGRLLINYDSGHFTSQRERLANLLTPLLARLGIERDYQSFVREADFARMLRQVGFVVEDRKAFNTPLKPILPLVPHAQQDAVMQAWLAFELQLNAAGVIYDDSRAQLFGTRNFIVAPVAGAAS